MEPGRGIYRPGPKRYMRLHIEGRTLHSHGSGGLDALIAKDPLTHRARPGAYPATSAMRLAMRLAAALSGSLARCA